MPLTSQLGIRCLVWTGPTVAAPPPPEVSAALTEARVTNDARSGDGFELTFALGKDTASDYGLLTSGALDRFNRVTIAVIMGVVPQVLIDGIITEQSVSASDRPGQSTLTVRGKDVSLMMDLEEKNASFPNQADYVIFSSIIGNYSQYGLIPSPIPTNDTPIETQRVPRQAETDLQFIKKLADRNGYIFYVEPVTFGANTAYFGPNTRSGVPQATLMIDMNASTNLSALSFSVDGASPVSAKTSFLDTSSMSSVDLPSPSTLNTPPLSSTPVEARRTTLSRSAARYDSSAASVASAAAVTNAPDPVTANGTIDCVRYGNVLRARKLVGIAGAGQTNDGLYYVQSVTHSIKPHETYTQTFSASREGTGSLSLTLGSILGAI